MAEKKSVVVPKDTLGANLDVTRFVEQLVASTDVMDLNECFRSAVDTASYLSAIRSKTMVQASRYVPGIIRTFGEKAASGDMESARMILDYVGFAEKDVPAQINTQVNVSIPTLKDVLTVTPVTPIIEGGGTD